MKRSTCRALAGMLLGAARLPAQQSVEADKALLATERYVRPPAEVAKLVIAPRQLNSTLTQQSPDRTHFLVVHSEGLGSEAKFAKPHLYLGGLQVDYAANRVRSFTTRGQTSIEIVDALSGSRVTVKSPSGATLSSPNWSPSGAQVAYFANFDDATYVYVADAKSGTSRRLSERAALPVISTSLAWSPDGSAVYAVLIPSPRMAMPKAPAAAEGPVVRMTGGVKNKTPTYASLMQTPLEKAELEYYATGQLARIDQKGGVKAVGAPAMIDSVDVSPDGKYLRVSVAQKPFSYLVPVTAFGSHEELWSSDGRVIATLTRRPLRESDATGGDDNATTGRGGAGSDSAKRAFAWMPNGGVAYLAQDPAPRRGRDATVAATDSSDAATADSAGAPKRKDRLYTWTAPFAVGTARAINTSVGVTR